MVGVCCVCGAGSDRITRGRCNRCYHYVRKYGVDRPRDLLQLSDPRRRLTTAARLMRHCKMVDGGHWIWTGNRNHNGREGYGTIWMKGRPGERDYVHRVAWETWRGPIPDGLEIDHLCRVRDCFNPRHLEPVTHLENVRRSPLVGRAPWRRTA